MKVTAGGREAVTDSGFAAEIRKRSGENVFLCYQCLKCGSGCPVRDFMDSSPSRIMRYAQLGMAEQCMRGSTVWYCSSCQTCSARCPQGIDIAHVVDTIRIIAREKGKRVDTKGMKLFNALWMKMLEFGGRAYEIGLIGTLNSLSGKPFKDMGLGVKMISRRKLAFFPSITRPFAMMRLFSRARETKR